MDDFNEYNYLCHHGILGMKWGIRRFENRDGSLTPAGKARYADDKVGGSKKSESALTKESLSKGPIKKAQRKALQKEYRQVVDKCSRKLKSKYDAKQKELEEEAKHLLQKYSFDPDDGGGGRSKADEKAGQRYARIIDEMSELSSRQKAEAVKLADEIFKEKYGKRGLAVGSSLTFWESQGRMALSSNPNLKKY